jgi:hypothetical protein
MGQTCQNKVDTPLGVSDHRDKVAIVLLCEGLEVGGWFVPQPFDDIIFGQKNFQETLTDLQVGQKYFRGQLTNFLR